MQGNEAQAHEWENQEFEQINLNLMLCGDYLNRQLKVCWTVLILHTILQT
jgi:hypothetical protein